jgi:hypothetical protein
MHVNGASGRSARSSLPQFIVARISGQRPSDRSLRKGALGAWRNALAQLTAMAPSRNGAKRSRPRAAASGMEATWPCHLAAVYTATKSIAAKVSCANQRA